MSHAVVRNESGAVLGIDWRRVPGSTLTVPGMVPAWAVMPGDSAWLAGTVVTVAESGAADDRKSRVRFRVLFEDGTSALVVVPWEARVQVIGVGGFDPKEEVSARG